MGFVKVRVKIGNPEKPSVSKEVELIADTEAIYTVVSKKILEELGIRKRGKRKFKLANGKIIEREVGIIKIEVKETVAYTTVFFRRRKRHTSPRRHSFRRTWNANRPYNGRTKTDGTSITRNT